MSSNNIQLSGGAVVTDAETAAQARRKHLRWSQYLITINTQQVWDPDNEQVQLVYAGLLRALNQIVKPADVGALITVLEQGHSLTPEYVKEVTLNAGVEKQGKNGRLHAHITVKVAHYTRVKLNYDEIKDVVKRETGLPNIYFHSRVFTQPNQLEHALNNYLQKEHVATKTLST